MHSTKWMNAPCAQSPPAPTLTPRRPCCLQPFVNFHSPPGGRTAKPSRSPASQGHPRKHARVRPDPSPNSSGPNDTCLGKVRTNCSGLTLKDGVTGSIRSAGRTASLCSLRRRCSAPVNRLPALGGPSRVAFLRSFSRRLRWQIASERFREASQGHRRAQTTTGGNSC